ncbi:DNA-methyltransferase [Bacillus cereus group sp. Bce033]|uniref:DNA-methyltransferase n=1 Tax=Bacillus TaxID=1386 RepID=UPI000F50436F|nr:MULTISPECIES: site-specific DNA-methyltransferase [Bacillus]AYY28388.1 site-specific DNA-methyltransferase [Bacillus sp. FDAARGOS_527]MDA1789233.1 site-specific DNA-methyltransferase [Bacillus cereus group sp. BY5-1LC]MDA1985499.1 site-specific DNA-methyltransferase [Bacillus cereus group sp. Bcc13]MDK7448574.1 site-specific DNA-methyltransferase [Bacillus paranthracis]MDN8632010.1 site-specific DNA-methyltransferase [Bacillus paranthracis]
MLNQVFNMDCLEGMKMIPDKSVDMILCDLPYGTTACKWDSIIPFDLLWQQYERIIKDNGAILLTASQPFTTKLIASNMKLFRYEWIWKKGNHVTGFPNANRMPLKNHENVLVFYKKLPKYYPQDLILLDKPIRKKEIRNMKVFGKRNNESLNNVYVKKYTNYPKSVIDFPRDSKTFHPTQKPVALFEYLIKTYTKEGETVLDNCMGSFTTAIACINTKRNYIGFEMDEEYWNLGNKRVNKHIESLKHS